MYITIGFFKFWEEDNYNSGCNPDTKKSYTDNMTTFRADTQDEIIKKILDFLGVGMDCVTLNSCEEDGRIDIYRLEDDDGDMATEHQIEQWEEYELSLYSAIYTFQVYKTEKIKLNEVKS